ncbi:lytic transglycosylase domain-containing protein [Salinibacterium sp. ZJ454]|uniref:aggregation-promoting factor C-terminal-like domain-containing protein n=1 Tax=Salinibacterium sp. ZJ454 TaxID=2708339 RepID=UPI001AB0360D|nr:lytic transglycosylase domain-containing protein [Salinibacterium sp. ZJ454]
MGRHSRNETVLEAVPEAPESSIRRPQDKPRIVLPMLAMLAVLGFFSVTLVDPNAGAYAGMGRPEAPASAAPEGQTLEASAAAASLASSRDAWKVIKPEPPKPVAPPAAKGSGTAPVAGTPDPGSAKAVAQGLVSARGWGDGQYDCLVSLWQKESGWNVYASNKSSGAYGIPQALPGRKMATVGADWQTNPATQITWGLNYIQGRYGDPCSAWATSRSRGWY